MKKKVILLIRDGWGYREECEDNCICQTPTPHTDKLMAEYPNTLLDCSGEAVGLPDGYQGNSEVGHLTIGSGRVIFQAMVRINKAIKDGSFFTIPELVGAIDNCKKYNTALHLIGLLQVEGVHAHRDHLFALLDLCNKMDFTNVCIHLVTDGRDAPVTDSLKHATLLQEKLDTDGCIREAVFGGEHIRHAVFIDGGSAMKVYGVTKDRRTLRLDLLNRVAAGSRNGPGIDPDGLNLYTLLNLHVTI